MAERMVRIEHPETHEEYIMSLSDYRKVKDYRKPGSPEDTPPQTYQAAGFVIRSNADYTPFEDDALKPESKPAATPAEKEG